MEQLVEVWRGDFLECVHFGDVAVCDASGELIASWGDPHKTILPRSSCKIVQALPLIESGAADKIGLKEHHLALACASHQGASIHVEAVQGWLNTLNLAEQDLRCGAQQSSDKTLRETMIRNGTVPDQRHNNCSGKHSGFLTLNQHLGGGAEYHDPSHPVQLAVREVTESLADEVAKGFVTDGCSAPNFAISLRGLAGSMARLAAPQNLGETRRSAAERLVKAMARRPEMVAGEGRACTELIRAMSNGTVVKTGAEGVFTAILPTRGLGVALKIADGATRASEAAIAALLVRLGVADPKDPMVQKRLTPITKNWNSIEVGQVRPSHALYQNGAPL